MLRDSQLLVPVLVILFGIEFGVSQHQADGRDAARGIDQRGKSAAVTPRALASPLRQNDLFIQVGDIRYFS